MKVDLINDRILIVPETRFERDFINENFEYGNSLSAFIKTGVTPANMLGIKINFTSKKDEHNE